MGTSGRRGKAIDRDPKVVESFHRLYYGDHRGTTAPWLNTFWLGVRTLKCPLDLWIYQEILFEVRPELIVECGTAYGGTSLFLAHVCDLLGCGEIISIDISSERLPYHPRISYWRGSSVDTGVVDQVYRQAAGQAPVLVILDSDHRRDHVLQEMRLYAPLVPPGSYLVVEDTDINGHPVAEDFGPGPMEAVELFLRENDQFEPDRGREKHLMTCNPGGFLRRLPGS